MENRLKQVKKKKETLETYSFIFDNGNSLFFLIYNKWCVYINTESLTPIQNN